MNAHRLLEHGRWQKWTRALSLYKAAGVRGYAGHRGVYPDGVLTAADYIHLYRRE